jgi:hypothetical protein
MMSWPRDLPSNDKLNAIWIADLANHSERALLAFTMNSHLRFYDLKFLPTQPNDGKITYDVPLPKQTGETVYGYSRSGTVIHVTHGNLFKAVRRDIVIPAIPARNPSLKLYVVNQSRFIVGFEIPQSAPTTIDGQPR